MPVVFTIVKNSLKYDEKLEIEEFEFAESDTSRPLQNYAIVFRLLFSHLSMSK